MLLPLLSLLMVSTVSISPDRESWRIINDGVMGGVSSGRIETHDDALVFSGELSLENNGGFASIRKRVEQDLDGADKVSIKVRGDGRRYQFRLRIDGRFDGVSWVSEFDTGSEWQTVTLPLSEFTPQFRGRLVRGAPQLDGAAIRQVGFLLADKNEGPFRLEIRSIEFSGDPADAE